jgi:CDP-paratose 2-epimerase
MKWIITGGAGFIGSNIAKQLLEKGGTPVIIDTLIRPRVALNADWLMSSYGIKVISIDIRDKQKMSDVFSKNLDASAVIHLAGQVSLLDSINHPRNDFEINALGTLTVLECLKEFIPSAHLIYSSSNKVYGDLSNHLYNETVSRYQLKDWPDGVNEKFEILPSGGYGVSKYSAELLINDWSNSYNLKSTILRQGSIYGERQFSTSDQGWAAYFIEQFQLNEKFNINGNGKQVRDLLYVDDLFDLIYKLVGLGTSAIGTFNVGGGTTNSLSLLELFELLQKITGNSPSYIKGGNRPHDQKVFISDNSRITKRTGWLPSVSYTDGLIKLLEWTRFHNS